MLTKRHFTSFSDRITSRIKDDSTANKNQKKVETILVEASPRISTSPLQGADQTTTICNLDCYRYLNEPIMEKKAAEARATIAKVYGQPIPPGALSTRQYALIREPQLLQTTVIEYSGGLIYPSQSTKSVSSGHHSKLITNSSPLLNPPRSSPFRSTTVSPALISTVASEREEKKEGVPPQEVSVPLQGFGRSGAMGGYETTVVPMGCKGDNTKSTGNHSVLTSSPISGSISLSGSFNGQTSQTMNSSVLNGSSLSAQNTTAGTTAQPPISPSTYHMNTLVKDSTALFHGHGKLVSSLGYVFEGEFNHGLMHGKGNIQWTNGTCYEGTFALGVPIGLGKYRWPNGDWYEGQVFNGVRSGTGIYFMRLTGEIYEGEWLSGMRHGKGTLVYAPNASDSTLAKCQYEGEWHSDAKCGKGTMTYRNGEQYEGEWKGDKRHGWGTMVWKEENQPVEMYTGEWNDGVQDGYGESTYIRLSKIPDHHFPATEGTMRAATREKIINSYCGDYKKGKRHGFGVFVYDDGSRYEGHWEDNQKHGEGKMSNANGVLFIGMFNMGVPVKESDTEDVSFPLDDQQLCKKKVTGQIGDSLDGSKDNSNIKSPTKQTTKQSDSRLSIQSTATGTGRGSNIGNNAPITKIIGAPLPLYINDLLGISEQKPDEVIADVQTVISRHRGLLKKIFYFYSNLEENVDLITTPTDSIESHYKCSPRGVNNSTFEQKSKTWKKTKTHGTMHIIQFFRFCSDSHLINRDVTPATIGRVLCAFRDHHLTTEASNYGKIVIADKSQTEVNKTEVKAKSTKGSSPSSPKGSPLSTQTVSRTQKLNKNKVTPDAQFSQSPALPLSVNTPYAYIIPWREYRANLHSLQNGELTFRDFVEAIIRLAVSMFRNDEASGVYGSLSNRLSIIIEDYLLPFACNSDYFLPLCPLSRKHMNLLVLMSAKVLKENTSPLIKNGVRKTPPCGLSATGEPVNAKRNDAVSPRDATNDNSDYKKDHLKLFIDLFMLCTTSTYFPGGINTDRGNPHHAENIYLSNSASQSILSNAGASKEGRAVSPLTSSCRPVMASHLALSISDVQFAKLNSARKLDSISFPTVASESTSPFLSPPESPFSKPTSPPPDASPCSVSFYHNPIAGTTITVRQFFLLIKDISRRAKDRADVDMYKTQTNHSYNAYDAAILDDKKGITVPYLIKLLNCGSGKIGEHDRFKSLTRKVQKTQHSVFAENKRLETAAAATAAIEARHLQATSCCNDSANNVDSNNNSINAGRRAISTLDSYDVSSPISSIDTSQHVTSGVSYHVSNISFSPPTHEDAVARADALYRATWALKQKSKGLHHRNELNSQIMDRELIFVEFVELLLSLALIVMQKRQQWSIKESGRSKDDNGVCEDTMIQAFFNQIIVPFYREVC